MGCMFLSKAVIFHDFSRDSDEKALDLGGPLASLVPHWYPMFEPRCHDVMCVLLMALKSLLVALF